MCLRVPSAFGVLLKEKNRISRIKLVNFAARLTCYKNVQIVNTSKRHYSSQSLKGLLNYTQGQYNLEEPTVREYFYYIDHNGMLFLDDARMKNFTSCFKEKKFLQFFFNRIKRTPTTSANLSKHFPFTSYCGKERNYTRTHDNATPFVFTTLTETTTSEQQQTFDYNNTGLLHPFTPSSLYVASNGRLYHEFKYRIGGVVNFALIKSSVADAMISQHLLYKDGSVGGGDGFEETGSREGPPQQPIAYITNKERRESIKLDYSLRDMVEKALQDGGVSHF